MKSAICRRTFLRQIAKVSVAASTVTGVLPVFNSGIEPILREGPARLLLSLAAYSFRDFFRDSSHRQNTKAGAAPELDLFQFMDYCAAHGCLGTELTSYYFPKEISDEFLLRLKRHAFQRGLAISGTAVGNTFTSPSAERRAQEVRSVKQWIDRAQLMGAPHIRVFAGSAETVAPKEARKYAIDALQECCAYAGSKGVSLGLENHGGIVARADDLLEIVKAVDSPWFGINLDTGNFNSADPYEDLARCAPYAVNVQWKTEIQRSGKSKELADFDRLAAILRKARYQGYVALEYEAAEDPWKAIPDVLTRMQSVFRV